ncbi:MAG: hypothetical protein QXT79_03150 [Thermofilaceae archaeon]
MRVKYVIYTESPEKVFMDFVDEIVLSKISEMGCFPVCDVAFCEVSMPAKKPKTATYITSRKNVYRLIWENDTLYFEFVGTRNALSEGAFAGIIKHIDKRNAIVTIGGKEYEAYLVEYETSTPQEWDLWPTDKIENIDGKYYAVRDGKILFEIKEKKDMYESKRCPEIESCLNATVYCRTDYTICPYYQSSQFD